MGQHREFPKRRQPERPTEHQPGAGLIRVLDGPAWAEAWPHLDDWFRPEAFFIGKIGLTP